LKRAADVVLSDIGLRGVAKEITFAESVAAREVITKNEITKNTIRRLKR